MAVDCQRRRPTWDIGVRRLGAATCAGLALMLALAPLAGGAADVVAAAMPAAVPLAMAALALRRSGELAAALAALAAAALAAALLAGERLGGPPAPDRAGVRLVVVQHNVAEANVDPSGTAAALTASGADILLLQEVNGRFAPMLDRLRARYPYGSRCRPRCSLAILSRFPMTRPRYRWRDADGTAYGPALVQARVRVPGVPIPVPVATVHLSRRLAFAAQAIERDALADAVARAGAQRAMLIGGDLNLVPWSAGMRRLDERLKPLRRATRAIFSFPARLSGRTFPAPLAPIDHLFVGPAWRVAGVTRMARTGSDHYPVRVILVWQGG